MRKVKLTLQIETLAERIMPSTVVVVDTNMPETGNLNPVIIAPVPNTPPPTLLA